MGSLWLRYLFFAVIVRPVLLLVLGLNVRNRSRLPQQGPAIIVANHNSHLDTLALMTLFPFSKLKDIHPVAAADYFLRTPLRSWFARSVIGIIPLNREIRVSHHDPFAEASRALEQGKILLLFPEGSRGAPEKMGELKSGVSHLARRHPEVPVIPVFMHGLGKALPKGEGLLVPFFCDVFIGEPVYWQGDRQQHIDLLTARFKELDAQCCHSDEW